MDEEQILEKDVNELLNSDLSSLLKSKKSIKKIKREIFPDVYLTGVLPVWNGSKFLGAGLVFTYMIHNDCERELQTILDSSFDGIWILDGEGKTLRVNRSFEKWFGIKPEEIIGKTVKELIAKGYCTESAVEEVIECKQAVTVLQQLKSGKKALITSTPIFRSDGTIWRIINNVRDITKLVELEQQLTLTKSLSEKYNKELAKQNTIAAGVVVRSGKMLKVIETALQVAPTECSILLLGETGVGKDVLARYIHQQSARNNKPFIKINCGAIPENLLESELFGFETGAFTGARSGGKMGMFELANGGTLFLDEITELPLNLQVKLLHALQDWEVVRVGGTKPIKLNIRLIAATNRDIYNLVKNNQFREDLFYRICVIPLTVPPLREREEDIAPLINFFLEQLNKENKKNKVINAQVIERFERYDWPGNVRQLKNAVERLYYLTQGNEITVDHLPPFLCDEVSNNDFSFYSKKPVPLKQAVTEVEIHLIKQAMKEGGSTYKAAELLGIDQSTIVKKIKRYGISQSQLH